jgi:hypothetical protein
MSHASAGLAASAVLAPQDVGMDYQAFVFTVLTSTVVSSAITGIITFIVQRNAQRQQQLLETTRLFTDTIALAHARDAHGRTDPIGLSEMIAGVQMVATIGLSYKPLRPAAIAFLESHVAGYSGAENTTEPSPVQVASKKALARLK